MTKPYNIFLLSRITNETSFNRVKTHSCGETQAKKTPYHEIISFKQLADGFLENGVDVPSLDGFFIGYQIPRIGKEFDLLKFSKNECLNIEIKSRSVAKKDIHEQLLKNRHYLSHLGLKTHFFTVITDTLSSYTLTDSGALEKIDFSVVCECVKTFSGEYLTDIDNMFKAGDYLVSPLSTPEKFIKGEYFLTQAQDFIKKRVIIDLENHSFKGFYSIFGAGGTGKTLLLYDIAKTLCKSSKTLVVHWGELFSAEEKLNQEIENFRVISLKELEENPDVILTFKIILIDEAQKMTAEQFLKLKNALKATNQAVIFSADPDQVVTLSEKKNAICKKIKALPLFGKYILRERIRVNAQLATFIASLQNLNEKPKVPIKYDDVSLCFAKNEAEAEKIISYYRQNGYVFISYSKCERFARYEEDFLVQHVLGHEFDNVLMLLDSSFYYDKSGHLKGIPPKDSDLIYPNLFYQGITRVREKLVLVVVGSDKLFNRISTLIDTPKKERKA